MHRSQGFGAVPTRGARLEYFEPLAGEPAREDLLEGVDLTWGRLRGGAAVGALLAQARGAYEPARPEAALSFLLKAKAALERMPPDPWVDVKRGELVEAIRCSAGLWAEAIAERPAASPGETVAVTATLIARGSAAITEKGLVVDGVASPRDKRLALNLPEAETLAFRVPADAPLTQPYWLDDRIAGPLAGAAEAPPAFQATFRLEAEGVPFALTVPLQFRYRDPVLGERHQPFSVTPAVMVNLAEAVQILGDGAPRRISLDLIAGRGPVAGQVKLSVPRGGRPNPPRSPSPSPGPGKRARSFRPSRRLPGPA